jgi:hypothetical protein
LARAEVLTKQLTKRFGRIPPGVVQKIRSAHSPQLEEWALRLMDASSLNEVFLG